MFRLIFRRSLCWIAVVVLWQDALVADEAEPTAGEVRIFDGKPKLLIVHGYSTSQHWWAFLQRKIDRYSGGVDDRQVEVQPCIKGGTPIARWMNVDTRQPSEAWTRQLTPMIRAEAGRRQVIVLAQQSLQGVFPGGRNVGIRGPDDASRIKRGADAIESYCQRILDDGADAVIIGMHIFKHTMEPAIGNERLALGALIERQPSLVYAGPDTWAPTKESFPLAFDRDRLHPNFVGAEIMAHHWFDALLRREEIETPAWSREEMERAIEDQPLGKVRDGRIFTEKLREWNVQRSISDRGNSSRLNRSGS